MGGSGRTIDLLGRTTFATVTVGSQTYTSEYHFAQGGYGTNSRTGMVTSIAQAGKMWSYSYDDNGNITQGYDRGKWFAYTYDALGQLIQVNDRSDTRAASDGSTWAYSYDQGGNILSKKLYPYANTSGTPIATTTFTYGDPNWRDKLTAVNGVAITYDAIGNPLNDGTWTYTWQNGRQLAGMANGTTTANFVYNKDGLRVQKTVNGVVTRYTLNGKNVAHMTRGNDDLHFFYDVQNRPAVVMYNGTAYAYLTNLQGDIVAILDQNGNAVVEYTYDAWGNPTSKTGSMASTLGVLNPFRYRGYVYDDETELYYLRSRYYKPSWCRFVNADAVLLKGILTCNQQAYCINNPVLFTDSNGRNFLDDIVRFFTEIVSENQMIAQYNAQAEHEALCSVASAGWNWFVGVVNESQRVQQANAQAEISAIYQVAQEAWKFLQFATEVNQKNAQEKLQAEYQARKDILFWIDGLSEKIDKAWSLASHATTTAGFLFTKGAAKTVLGWGSVAIWVIDGVFIYANWMTDMWRKEEDAE